MFLILFIGPLLLLCYSLYYVKGLCHVIHPFLKSSDCVMISVLNSPPNILLISVSLRSLVLAFSCSFIWEKLLCFFSLSKSLCLPLCVRKNRCFSNSFLFFKILFIERERERERENAHMCIHMRWGRDRGRGRSKFPAEQGAWHRAQSQNPEIMTWIEGRYPTDWATQVPQYFSYS